MDEYAGRVLADRYRLPLPPSDEYEFAETRAFDTYSAQEVLVRQVPLPEIIEAEVVDADGGSGPAAHRRGQGRTERSLTDPAVLRAIEAAQAAAQVPDHPRLDQVFDVFAEDGSLWIVSERVAARPLAALLAEQPLTPYRAAEVASDVLTALRALHTYGWTHRNITARTVLVCDDGRIVLTGLASGAAEEALCGYAPVPAPHESRGDFGEVDFDEFGSFGEGRESAEGPEGYAGPDGHTGHDGHEEYGGQQEREEQEEYGDHVPDAQGPYPPRSGAGTGTGVPDVRAARAGAIAAYRAGARAAARVSEEQRQGDRPVQTGRDPDWWARKPGGGGHQPPYRIDRDEQGDDDPDGYEDPDRFDDGYGAGGPGRARLAGAWHDGPRPGQDGPPPLPAGGGFAPAPRSRRTGIRQEGPSPRQDGPPPLPAGGGFEPAPHHPYRDNDPYGVREPLPPGDGPAGERPTAPGPLGSGRVGIEPAADRPAGNGPAGHGPGGGGLPGAARPGGAPARDGGDLPVLPSARGGRPGGDPHRDRPSAPRADTRGFTAPAPVTGSWDRGGAGREALRADAERRPLPAVTQAPAAGWDEAVGGPEAPAYRGPTTPLAAERARQARIAVIGAVTERWAPEQAGPVHENWQLAAPVGPATDLWALGALLYRSVQGHAPYPEENAAELVQLVCAEPPAFAEECGPLRPVVESLLRQDPTERPDVEELRGWLRSLVRSAPEPEAGMDVVPLPSSAVDGSRLPVVRRRGELVRRRRTGSTEVVHGRHRQRKAKRERRPRSLGRTLLLLILLLLAGAVAYAVMFMPKSDEQDRTAPQGDSGPIPSASGTTDAKPGGTQGADPGGTASAPPGPGTGSQQSRTSSPVGGNLADGYELRSDPEGFRTAVDKSWQRRPINDAGQVRYSNGDFTLIIVPGRDAVGSNGEDPLVYQRDRERELQPFRDSSWATSSGLRRIEIGQQVMAEGQFTWQDSNGREVFVRNRALVIGGRYHVVQVIGPSDRRDKVTEAYEQAVNTYRKTD